MLYLKYMKRTPQELRFYYQAEFNKWLTLHIQNKITKKQLIQKSKKYFPLIEMYHQLEVKQHAALYK